MIIYYTDLKRIFTISLFLLAGYLCHSQKRIIYSWQPEISATWKIPNRWQINIKTASVSSYTNMQEGEEGLSFQNMEISSTATYRIFTNQSFSLGYLYRRTDPFEEDPGYEHRITEQTGFSAMIGSNRIGNRIRLEQRFRPAGLIHRWRYRLSLDLPLNGEEINPGEMYLIMSDEILFSFGKPVSSFGENRLSGGLGWYFTNKTKFEVNAQYRTTNILKEKLVHVFMLLTTFYLNY